MAVKPIPDGYQSVIPYVIANDAEALLRFLTAAFGAKEKDVNRDPSGTIFHGEVIIGDSVVMFSQASERHPAMPCTVYVYVPDTDATYRAALAAGATSVMEPANQFYGDRNAGVKDSNGNQWWMGTHVEDVSPEELERRAAEEMKKRAAAG
jgi:PhnB protein